MTISHRVGIALAAEAAGFASLWTPVPFIQLETVGKVDDPIREP